MMYKCIKDTWIKGINVMCKDDIIIVNDNKTQIHNLNSNKDIVDIHFDHLIKNLVHMSDNCEISPRNIGRTVENSDNTHPFENITKEMFNTYLKKNKDYGNSFDQSLDKWGLSVAAIRLGDKLNRFESFVKNGSFAVNDESVRDTLLDLCCYSVMTIMYLNNKSNGNV